MSQGTHKLDCGMALFVSRRESSTLISSLAEDGLASATAPERPMSWEVLSVGYGNICKCVEVQTFLACTAAFVALQASQAGISGIIGF